MCRRENMNGILEGREQNTEKNQDRGETSKKKI